MIWFDLDVVIFVCWEFGLMRMLKVGEFRDVEVSVWVVNSEGVILSVFFCYNFVVD